jgi:glycerophosphoryl diester phosphodiesterase
MKKFFTNVLRVIIFVAVFFLLINILPANDAVPLNGFKIPKGSKVKIATKSGGSAQYPPNVLASFNEASSHGIMVFSIGVYLTKDDQLVVSDSDELNTFTEAESGRITASYYADIIKLNSAYLFKNEKGKYPYRKEPLRCVNLNELFLNFPYTDFVISIEMDKEKAERSLIILSELVRQNGLSTRIVIKASKEISAYAKKMTNVTLFTSPTKEELNTYNLFMKYFVPKLYSNLAFQHIELSLTDASRYPKQLFTSLMNRNVSLYISGVNNKADLTKALTYSPDGVVTNEPELINSLLSAESK